jgi:hypothetical protein
MFLTFETRLSHSDSLRCLINLLSTAAEIRAIGKNLEVTELKRMAVIEDVFKIDLK